MNSKSGSLSYAQKEAHGYERVSVFLPLKKRTNRIINTLITRLSEDFGGLTISRYAGIQHNPFFLGYWKNPRTGKWNEDNICWIIIDVDRTLKINVVEYFGNLKDELEEKIREDVLWIISHHAEQVATFMHKLIIKISNGGGIIELDDGSTWEVTPPHRTRTRAWQAGHKVTTIDSENAEYPYVLVNLCQIDSALIKPVQ